MGNIQDRSSKVLIRTSDVLAGVNLSVNVLSSLHSCAPLSVFHLMSSYNTTTILTTMNLQGFLSCFI